jgi:DNA-binding helix-hairpin-helix protein with protein kinase domain
MRSSNEGTHTGMVVSVEGTTLTVSNKIKSGNEGTVYRIKNTENKVFKIFNEKKRSDKKRKITAMIANDPNHPAIIWPQAVVKDLNTGAFLGYQMKYKDLDTAQNAFEYTLTQLSWDSTEKSHRYTVAKNLAVMVSAIHNEGHAIGDFNHDNILIDNNGQITLIDCDGFHITDEDVEFPDDTYYPRYAPPEGRGGNTISNVREADRFCLGVHIFQFLMEGFHPYHAKGSNAENGNMEDKLKNNKFPYVDYEGYNPIDSAPSVDDYEMEMTDEIQSLFRRCFTESGKHKATESMATETNRPYPEEWRKALSNSCETGNSLEKDTSGSAVVRPNSGSQDESPGTGSDVSIVTPESAGNTEEDAGIDVVTPDSSSSNTQKQEDDEDKITPVMPEDNNDETEPASTENKKNNKN